MTRAEIITMFRTENPEITIRVVSGPLLHDWCKVGDKEVCARTRCIVDQDGTTITTAEDDQYWDLTSEISDFADIDEYPGGGVAYNDKRLKETTIAKLDDDCPSWRTRSAGTPLEYYRRGKWIYLDRPVNSLAHDLRIYAVLISDDFDDDGKTPYNQLTYLEPFHAGILKFLQWRAKSKIGKQQDASVAKQDFVDYTLWMKKEIGGMKFGPIVFRPKL